MIILFAIASTAAITCAFGWLGCRSRLREERKWTEHYRKCLERRDPALRPQTTAERIDAWLREAKP